MTHGSPGHVENSEALSEVARFEDHGYPTSAKASSALRTFCRTTS